MRCSNCGLELDDDAFYVCRTASSGRFSQCKVCMRAKQKLYREANKEKMKERVKRYRKEKPTETLDTARRYRRNNKERYQSTNREYYRSVRRGDKGSLLQLKDRIRALLGASLRKNGFTKRSKTYAMLGCSYEELLLHLGAKPVGDVDIDHICPCDQAQDENELILLQHYSNLRWCPRAINKQKNKYQTIEGERLCLELLGRKWIDSRLEDVKQRSKDE